MAITAIARHAVSHPSSAQTSGFMGARKRDITLNRSQTLNAVQHQGSPALRAAATTLDAGVSGFSMPPKALHDVAGTGSKLREALYYAIQLGYPAKAPATFTSSGVPAFKGAPQDQMMTVAPLSEGAMLATMKKDFIPAADSQAGQAPGAIAKNTNAVLQAFDELKRGGGTKFYKTHYEDDTQVYDGYVAVNAASGEIRQLATYSDG
jgi:hypothetical protein